jgi:hypothetical protein
MGRRATDPRADHWRMPYHTIVNLDAPPELATDRGALPSVPVRLQLALVEKHIPPTKASAEGGRDLLRPGHCYLRCALRLGGLGLASGIVAEASQYVYLPATGVGKDSPTKASAKCGWD